MKKNSMSAKLAAGVRQAKQHNTVSAAAPAATSVITPAAPPAISAMTAAAAPAKASAPVARAPAKKSDLRYAQQTDQRPASSLDDPWANLHPQRIWPD